MARNVLLRDYDAGRLRRVLAAFFVALALPTCVLIWQAYDRLEFETYFQYRSQAEALTVQIDGTLLDGIKRLNNLPADDFAFVSAAGNVYQRSPLSTLPIRADLPGVLGYFQIDASGSLTTPLLPAAGITPDDVGIEFDDLNRRREAENRIRSILVDNALVDTRDAMTPSAPGDDGAGDALDSVSRERVDEDLLSSNAPAARVLADTTSSLSANRLGRLDDLELDEGLQQKSELRRQRLAEEEAELGAEQRRTGNAAQRAANYEASAVRVAAPEPVPADAAVTIDAFDRPLGAFEFSALDSGHLVLFRSAWVGDERLIQGVLLDRDTFFRAAIEDVFRSSSLATMSDLILGFRNDVVTVFRGQRSRSYPASASDLQGDLLHRTRLSAPLNDLELVFSITRLPPGPAGRVLAWTTLVIAVVILGGIYALYRLGLNQIRLARQQQDFVSAVSHELKTPLTSIRMYGEMLKEGWADDEKRGQYYDYIHAESERLTRLISNVLELARITRNEPQFDLQVRTVGELLDQVRSKISNQIEQAGFDVAIEALPETSAASVRLDDDCFAQIMINLVDNAIKFSGGAPERRIEIGCEPDGEDRIVFTVRDHGPGIPRDALEKIFRLFYRTESELTRETVGTGIGLAIVHQLTAAMGGSVDVVNREPGAEFRVSFPRAPAA